jgi:MoxR-like ATPase
MSTPTPQATISCAICGHADHWLGDHIVVHGMTVKEYVAAHGQVASDTLMVALEVDAPARRRPDLTDIKVEFAGVRARVNADVPADACLPLPPAYRVPQHGALSMDIREAAVSLVRGRSVYVWGLPGSGKDALFHAWSALTRTPAMIFQVEPGADIRSWFFTHEFNKDGTYWAEGDLLKALRDGYRTSTGRVIPYMILITDFDRATKEQAESMRLVMDSISGRVKGPNGVTYPVLAGTQVVVTANTAGAGDSRGRCTSSNVIDASILDRFERAYEFHWMDWRDEGVIVKEKFPILLSKASGAFDQVGRATEALRKAVQDEALYAEFSHRALCAWLGHAEDIVAVSDSVPADLLRRAFRAVADKMPDAETRAEAVRIVDPHLRGGSLDHGNTGHIRGLR